MTGLVAIILEERLLTNLADIFTSLLSLSGFSLFRLLLKLFLQFLSFLHLDPTPLFLSFFGYSLSFNPFSHGLLLK